MNARGILSVLGVLAVVGLLAFGLLSKGGAKLSVGEKVPDKTLPLLDGKGKANLADFRGKWVLVNLWASWCPPCREEAPTLERFYQRHRGGNFTIVGINVQDNADDARAFARSFHATYPQLRSVGSERSDAFGSNGVPENFLVNPRGRLALIQRSPLDDTYLRRYIVPRIEAVG